jgi:hypothetical protein
MIGYGRAAHVQSAEFGENGGNQNRNVGACGVVEVEGVEIYHGHSVANALAVNCAASIEWKQLDGCQQLQLAHGIGRQTRAVLYAQRTQFCEVSDGWEGVGGDKGHACDRKRGEMPW